jgi:flagellar protein FlgJ
VDAQPAVADLVRAGTGRDTGRYERQVHRPRRVGRPGEHAYSKVPASVTIAQAILESGWGRSPLTTQDHSYFGMKCFGDPGGIALGCSTYATRECDGSRCFGIRDSFRAYRKAAGSFADHGKQLSTLPRCATAMKFVASPDRFAVEIHKAGYATSPTYAKNLIAIVKQFGLYKYSSAGRP